MDRRPFQYSLFSLLVLTTACAVVLSFVKTFPNAALRVAEVTLMSVGPLLFFLGNLFVFHGEIFFRHSKRFARVYAPLVGFVALSLACCCVPWCWAEPRQISLDGRGPEFKVNYRYSLLKQGVER